MTVRSATNNQIADWRDATMGLSPEPRWSDFVIRALIERIDEDRDRICAVLTERDTYRFAAEQRVYVREELADLLGTEDVGEAVRIIKAWKAAAEAGAVAL